MERKIIVKYLLISSLLILSAFFIAFQFSWMFDDENAGKRIVFFLPIGLGWFGCMYFGILIQRLVKSKGIFKDKFLGPLDIIEEKILNELGLNYRNKFPFILIFPVFIFLILGFSIFKNNYKKKQLSQFGIEKVLRVESISFNKSGRNVHTTLNYNNKKFRYIFTVNDSLKKNDTLTIILSSKNPNINTLKSEYNQYNSN